MAKKKKVLLRKKVVRKPRRVKVSRKVKLQKGIAPKGVQKNVNSWQVAAAESVYEDGVCSDKVSLRVRVENEKMVDVEIKPSASSCESVKNAVGKVVSFLQGKRMGDVYRIDAASLADGEPDHGAFLVVNVAREAVLEYESRKATASLKEALDLLAGYDEGFPDRDVGKDYEY